MTKRTFSGRFDSQTIYGWLNPNIPRVEKYAPARLLGDFIEVDEPTYDYFLGMMPPVNFGHDRFAICEAVTGNIRLAFFHIQGRYFAAHVDDHEPGFTMAPTRGLIADHIPEVAA